jgi:hypothetical protein
MDLTDEDIREFAAAWREAFHETLTIGEARTEAVRLLTFYALLVEGPATPDASPPRPSTNS